MPVEQEGRFSRRLAMLGVDDRMPVGLLNGHMVDADALEVLGHPIRAARDVFFMGRVGRDARDAQIFFELLEESILIIGEVVGDFLVAHGRLRKGLREYQISWEILSARGPFASTMEGAIFGRGAS